MLLSRVILNIETQQCKVFTAETNWADVERLGPQDLDEKVWVWGACIAGNEEELKADLLGCTTSSYVGLVDPEDYEPYYTLGEPRLSMAF